MKRILFILILSVSSFFSNGQTTIPVTDTLQYLKKDIELNKHFYIGKPLSTLLNDLRIQPVADWLFNSPETRLDDPFKNSGILFYFDFRVFDDLPLDAIRRMIFGEDLSAYNLKDLFPTFLSIEFPAPVDVRVADVTWGGSMFGREWTPVKQNFWGSQIVGNIRVKGIPADIIYSRIEIKNLHEEEITDSNGGVHYEEAGEMFIRFYRDQNCTHPFYLDEDIEMTVKETYGSSSSSWGAEVQYSVPAGQNELSLGEKLLYSSYFSFDSSTNSLEFVNSFTSKFTIYPLPKFTAISNFFYY